jgi:oligopeptide/dipeptide ABC transporter ATP-binding protein
MPDEPPLLDVRGLSVRYGATRAVADIGFTIRRGEIVGLTGDSGSGKSSLALALLGLARPPGRIGGAVLLDGVDLLRLPARELRERRGRDIGLIVQNPRVSLSPLHTVGQQLRATLQAHQTLTRDAADTGAVKLLRSLGINDAERRMRAYPHEISGGMAQRVLIAMALGAGPRLLIADEPTSGLDVTIQAQFLDDMWRTVRQANSAALIMTQDLGIIANYCDRVIVLDGGRIVASETTRQLFAAPSDPYSRAVLALRQDVPAEAPPSATAPLLRVSGLRKTFHLSGGKTLQAIEDFSIAIDRSETLGLVGESGSGKTTVGRCLLRLLEADRGEIMFEGVNVTAAPPAELRGLRRRMQVVFQDPFDQLDPRWTVGAILGEALETPSTARIAELLRVVGLSPDIAGRTPRTLSAGAQQRVSIARAIAPEPALIVLDEPTSTLTPLARVDIVRLLRDLQARLGTSFLFISHDLDTIEHLSHRVAVMYLGQIVEIGTRAQVFGAPVHPYTKALLHAHLAPDPANRRVDRGGPDALSGEIPSPVDLPSGCYLAGRCPVAHAECARTRQVLTRLPDGREVRCAPAASAAFAVAA